MLLLGLLCLTQIRQPKFPVRTIELKKKKKKKKKIRRKKQGDQYTVAQQAGMTVDEHSLTSCQLACFLDVFSRYALG